VSDPRQESAVPSRPDALPTYPVAPQYSADAPHAAYDAFTTAPAKGNRIAATALGFGVFALVSDLIGFAWGFIGLSVSLRVLLAPLFAGSVYAAVAVALGHVALNLIRSSQGAMTGRSIALAGLILGYIGLAIWLVGTVVSYFTVRGRGI